MTILTPAEVTELCNEAATLRRMVLEMAYRAGSGHCGGSLSCAEVLAVLYGRVLRQRPIEPGWPERDRFILTKGHAAPMLYAVLARQGYFPAAWLDTLRALGSPLQGHPDMRKVPGVEMSTGSLGMGISNGIGMAWAARLRGEPWRTVVLVGDGELNEGQNWEAAMLAAKLGLAELLVIVDYNRVQLDGTTDEVMPLGDLAAKFQAFGWQAEACDGHDPAALYPALIKQSDGPPRVLIAHTVKGRGVAFMEGDHRWHGAPLAEADYRRAIAELESER